MMPPNADVLAHEEEVKSDQTDEFLMKATDLHKTYKKGNPAVQGNTFGVKRG